MANNKHKIINHQTLVQLHKLKFNKRRLFTLALATHMLPNIFHNQDQTLEQAQKVKEFIKQNWQKHFNTTNQKVPNLGIDCEIALDPYINPHSERHDQDFIISNMSAMAVMLSSFNKDLADNRGHGGFFYGVQYDDDLENINTDIAFNTALISFSTLGLHCHANNPDLKLINANAEDSGEGIFLHPEILFNLDVFTAQEEFKKEVAFQNTILQKLKAPFTKVLVLELLDYVLQSGKSNCGYDFDFKTADILKF